MPALKEPTVAGTLAWGGVLLGFCGALLFGERPGLAQPQPAAAGSASSGATTKPPLPPLPSSSAAAPATSPPPPASSAAPGAAPPPYMYQEPWVPPAAGKGEGPTPAPLPAPYVYEPPPPAPPMNRAPWMALHLGVRAGALFPFGQAFATYQYGYYEYGESWSGLATGGPSVEADVGARLGRHFIVFGFIEHAWMGKGSDASWRYPNPPYVPFGEQQSASTDFTGLGFRYSSNPNRVGILFDVGLGYRWFRERWETGAKMYLHGFGEFRLGAGADIRISRLLSITPLFSVSSGVFSNRQWTVPGQGTSEISGSMSGGHGTLNFTVGGNFDLFGDYN